MRPTPNDSPCSSPQQRSGSESGWAQHLAERHKWWKRAISFLQKYVSLKQGRALPKTEQKFENYARSAFKITDKQVSIAFFIKHCHPMAGVFLAFLRCIKFMCDPDKMYQPSLFKNCPLKRLKFFCSEDETLFSQQRDTETYSNIHFNLSHFHWTCETYDSLAAID